MLNNKKADMTLLGAIVAFALIILLSPVLLYMQLYEQVNQVNNNIESSFSDMCVTSSIVHYDNVKFNIEKSKYDSGVYSESLLKSNGFTKSGDEWKKDSIIIKNVKLDFNSKDYKYNLNYDISIPFRFFNKSVDNAVSIHKSFSSALVKR